MRIYKGEQLPQMDPGPTFKRKAEKNGKPKELVDPYCIVKFAGHKEETEVVPDCYDPVWNTEMRMSTSVSMVMEALQ